MERNVGGLLIYKNNKYYYVLNCRVCPFEEWGTLPLHFNIWQPLSQLKIFFLAQEGPFPYYK
jgi:hypothetical protein